MSPFMAAISDMALMPMMPLIAKFVWLASGPSQSSVSDWFPGWSAFPTRYCAHLSRRLY